VPNSHLICGFCWKPLPLPSQVDPLAAFAGQVHQCRHCGAAYALLVDGVNPRAAIAATLRVPAARLALYASPCLIELQDRPLFLVSGWDPAEMLSTVRVAQILELHRATVQQHVREGRFPGARLGQAAARGARGYWGIPRGALLAYLRAKGKPGAAEPGVGITLAP
jgi:hypothetical protein